MFRLDSREESGLSVLLFSIFFVLLLESRGGKRQEVLLFFCDGKKLFQDHGNVLALSHTVENEISSFSACFHLSAN